MRRHRLLALVFGLAVVAILAWFRISDPYPVQALRDLTFDEFQRLAPREEGDYPIRIVDIDEASLATIGQWPWPRDTLAALATRLTEMGAAAVAFDILFPEPDRLSPSRLAATLGADFLVADRSALPDFDQQFAAALAASPSILGLGDARSGLVPEAPKARFAIVGPNQDLAIPFMQGAVMPIALLAEATHGLGSVSLEPGGNVGIIRRLPLVWSNGTAVFPSLSIETLRVALGVQTGVVFTDQTGFGTVESVRIGGIEIPTTTDGALWLYYQPTPDNLYISAADILGDNATAFQDLIAGNIVLIGTSATGLLDIRGTPLGTSMPGVEIHAQALQQILSETYLRRADWVNGLEILAFVLVGITVVVALLLAGPLICLIIALVLAAGVAGGSWLAFRDGGLLIDPSFPLIGSFLVYTLMIFFRFMITDSDKKRIRGAFGFFVAPALLAQIEKDSDKLKLGGELRELSIMFSDVRNFTNLSEGFEPAKLVTLLNTLFGALGEQITERYGTIDKFIGDAVMAFWNAPVTVEHHARCACLAALDMRRTLVGLNARDAFRLRADGRAMEEIAIRIGISTGEALVGNLGLETRFDYSCVGDTVNVASRVEAACKTVGYDIVVVEATRAAAPELAYLEAGSIALKGKSRREPIHILVGDGEMATQPDFVALKAAHAEALEAIRCSTAVDAAIDRCLERIVFPDPMLRGFYEVMRTRQADYIPEPDLLVAPAHR